MISLYLLMLEDPEDCAQFERIWYAHQNLMLRVAFAVTKDQYGAEEAVADAMLSVAENFKSIKTESPVLLKSYLCRAAKNAAIDFLRCRHRACADVDIDTLFDLAAEENVADSVEAEDTYEHILLLIKEMPSLYRDVLMLHYLHDMSTCAIAEALERPHGTVKSQLTRGAKLLQTILKEAGYHE